MENNLLAGGVLDERGGNRDRQCLFCSDKIQNSPSHLLTAEVVESIPIILNFHPANIPNWNQRLLQTSLCSNCHQITVEGTELRLLLTDIQRKLAHISATITSRIRKGHFGDSASQQTSSGCAAYGRGGQDQIAVATLRRDLSLCLNLEPFPDSLEKQSNNYKHVLSVDDTKEAESCQDWHPTLVAVDDQGHLNEESLSTAEENDVLDNQGSDSDFTRESKRNRTVAAKFTQAEITLLLKLYKERSQDLVMARGKKNCRALVRSIWDGIARKVSMVANIQRKGQQCRKKIENYKYFVSPIEDHVAADDFEATPVAVNRDEILSNTHKPQHSQNNLNGYNVVSTSNGCFTLKNFQVKLQRCEQNSFAQKSYLTSTTPQQQQRCFHLKKRLHRQSPLAMLGEKLNQRTVYRSSKKKSSRLPPQDVHRTPQPPRHVCPVLECKEEFAGVVSLLESHIRDKHGGEFEHFCELCDKGFFSPIGLQTHKGRYHDETIRKFRCDLCPAKFLKDRHLSNHKFHVHEGPHTRTFLCEVCSAGFKHKYQLKTHQEKMHGDLYADRFKPERQPCESSAPLRKYVCTFPNCAKRFHVPSQLKIHLACVHAKERNFQCHLCPNSYRNIHLLNYHLSRHNGETTFKCPHCPKSLANPQSLRNHIKVIHESTPSIRCEDCGEGFPIRKYYLRHRLICSQGFSGTGKKSTPKHVEARRRREGYI